MHLNTAIAALHELVNELYAFVEQAGAVARSCAAPRRSGSVDPATRAVLAEAVESLVLMLSPFAPHMAEELWEQLGHARRRRRRGLAGVRSRGGQGRRDRRAGAGQRQAARASHRAADIDDAALEQAALADPQVQNYTRDKTVAKVVVAKGRLVSIVVK